MSGRPGVKKCDSCNGMHRVVSVSIEITHRSHSVRVPVLHLCEGCLLHAPDLAALSMQIPSVKHIGKTILTVIADSVRTAYCRWRGASV